MLVKMVLCRRSFSMVISNEWVCRVWGKYTYTYVVLREARGRARRGISPFEPIRRLVSRARGRRCGQRMRRETFVTLSTKLLEHYVRNIFVSSTVVACHLLEL